MDQDTLVSDNLSGGWRLVDALAGRGFGIEAAFWAKASEDDNWVFYIASPSVNERGLRESYRLVHDILRGAPEWGLDPFTVTVLDAGNPMAKAAADLVAHKVATGPFAAPNPKSHRGMTRFAGRSLGGIAVDGALIYPPWEPGLNPAG